MTSEATNLEFNSARSLTFDEVEEMLIAFSTSVLRKETAEDVYWSLAKNVISRLGFVDCVIYSVNHRTQSLVQRAAYGPKSPAKQILLKPLTDERPASEREASQATGPDGDPAGEHTRRAENDPPRPTERTAPAGKHASMSPGLKKALVARMNGRLDAYQRFADDAAVRRQGRDATDG